MRSVCLPRHPALAYLRLVRCFTTSSSAFAIGSSFVESDTSIPLCVPSLPVFALRANDELHKKSVMKRATTLIIAIITFVDGVASLNAGPCSVNSPPCDSIDYNPQPNRVFLIEVSEAVDPATVDATDFTLNGIPANAAILSNNNTWIQFIFNTSPQVRGINTMHIPGGAFNCLSNGPVLEFTCTFQWKPISSRPRPTPAPRP
jgi:hypothetical protein